MQKSRRQLTRSSGVASAVTKRFGSKTRASYSCPSVESLHSLAACMTSFRRLNDFYTFAAYAMPAARRYDP